MGMVELEGYPAADFQAVATMRAAAALLRIADAIETAGKEQANAIGDVGDVFEGIARQLFGHDEFAATMDRLRLEHGKTTPRDLKNEREWRNRQLINAGFRPDPRRQLRAHLREYRALRASGEKSDI